MRYNTNNPAPSNDPRDLNDNTLILDELMNSLEETAKDRFERDRYTVQAFHNIVIDAKAQIDPTVEAAKEAVNSTADAAIEEMQETAANLGDDLNNKRYATYAEMLADPQTRDAVVALVDGDQDPNLNGWYSWDNASKVWLRFVNQPANAAAVDARFYRTENRLTGSGDGLVDSTGGTLYISVEPKKSDSVTIISGLDEIANFDTLNNATRFSQKLVRTVDVLDVSSTHTDRAGRPDYEVLDNAADAKVILDRTGLAVLEVDTVEKIIRSNYPIEYGLEQRPPIVFVDVPPRLERNTNDPDYRLSGRVYQATATIARSGASRYWSAWRADNQFAGEAPGNFTVLAYSDDKNQTVKEYGYFTFTAADDPDNPLPIEQRAGRDKHLVDPMLWLDPDGRLWLFFGVMGNNKHFDGVQGTWAVICQNPNAEFPVWGQPFRLSYFGDPRHPVMVNGKWYLAVDGWRFSAEYPPFYMDRVGPHIYEFDWRNQKLRHVSQLPANNGTGYSGFFETEFVQLADGRVMALLRWTAGDSGVLVSYSSDLMKTWTPWVNYLVLAPAASSRIWLGRSPSGRLLVVWNNDTNRLALTLGLSDDEGVTYPYRIQLEPNSAGQLTYPVVAFGDNGEIFIEYDNQRTAGKRQIHIAKVIEQEVVAGTSVPVITIASDPFK
ncbi:sialidase family protein [Pseudomonas sp. PARCl1]|uniref:sialidase family protein n=1 Tax=Pseudomonas sp. PARCl1 TaxID=2853444 RepID=UPI00248D4292|nr:sialidase family protein [Pseudomonas sp. PARCl1]